MGENYLMNGNEKLDQVEALFSEEKFEEGLTLLKQLEKEFFADGDMLFQIGIFYYEVGDLEKALQIFSDLENLVDEDPELIHESHLYGAAALLGLGKTEEALSLLMELKEQGVVDYRLYSLLGELYRYEGLPEVAANYLEKALDLNPDQEEIRFWLGELYEEAGEGEKALAVWQGISGYEHDSRFLLKKANISARAGDFEEAKHLYEHALQHNSSPEALFGYGIVCYQMGEWQNAIRTFSQLIEIEPEYIAAYPLLAEALWELGLKEKSAMIYDQVVKLKGDDIHLLDRYLSILSELNQWEKVESLHEELASIDEEDVTIYYWKGRIAEKEGRLNEAVAFYQRVQNGGRVHDTQERLEKIINQ